MMNLNFDEIEQKNIDKLINTMEDLSDINGKTYSYYFKIYPGSVGLTVKFVCEELGIEKDITNYNNW